MNISMNEIAQAVNGRWLNKIDNNKITSMSIDSRKIEDNSLFIPIKGDNFDGHDYIRTVFDKGAKLVLSEREEVVDSRLAVIYVEDTKKALLDLAKYYRSLFDLPVIAITGSVGKTTTKDMISAILSGKYNVHKTQGNFNNEIGLPLTIFQLKHSHEVAVLEMGMNHFGEIHNLSTVANPQIAVITNIGTSHIENLGSREGILQAKLEILDGLELDGCLIINGDDELLRTTKDLNHTTIRYGKGSENQYSATGIICESMNVKTDIQSSKEKYQITINAPGEHMVYNTLAAIAVAEKLGLTKEEILKGLASYTSGKMRMNIFECENGLTIIDDTYNASPDSMKAAINVLMDLKPEGNKIAVLGDMLEMGEFADALHEEVGNYAAKSGVQVICSIGVFAQSIDKGARTTDTQGCSRYYRTKEAFLEDASRWLKKGDTILFKASRGMQFEQMVERIRKVKVNEK